MGMYSGGITGLSRRLAVAVWFLSTTPGCNQPPKDLDAVALGLPTIDRPDAATRGAPRAFLGAAAGALTIAAANGAPIEPLAGAPLLADDHLKLGDDGLAVIVFANGNVLRLEGPLDQELRGLAGFNSPPVGDNLETQLVAALSDADRERLGAANERIGGWQLRVTALEAPAPQSEQIPLDDRQLDRPAEDAAPPEEPGSAEIADQDGSKTGAGGSKKLGREPTTEDARPKPTPKDGPKPPEARTSYGNGDGEEVGDEEVDEAGDEEVGAGESTRRTSKASGGAPPWSLTSATWIISGDKVTVPSKLRDRIIACIGTTRPQRAIVELSVDSGVIRSLEVAKANLKCVEEFTGSEFSGLSTNGSIRLVFERP